MYEYVSCGLDGIQLANGYDEIEINGEKHVSIKALDTLHKVIAKTICELPRKLNGKEIRFLRVELDLSQKCLGNILDKSDQTVAKWEKGETPIPKPDDVMIRQYYSECQNEHSEVRLILQRLSELDRQLHELTFELNELENSEDWNQVAC